MTDSSGRRKYQDETWRANIGIEERLELSNRVQVSQLYSRRSRFVEQWRLDEQPGGEHNDSNHEQVTELQDASGRGRMYLHLLFLSLLLDYFLTYKDM